jgi:hypothetical protein
MGYGSTWAMKGYLTQAYLCLFDSLRTDWEWVSFDAIDDEEIVDLRWGRTDLTQKIVQVKAVANLTRGNVLRMVEKMLLAKADIRELILVGTAAELSSVAEAPEGGVTIRKVLLNSLQPDHLKGLILVALSKCLPEDQLRCLTLADATAFIDGCNLRLLESTQSCERISRREISERLSKSVAARATMFANREDELQAACKKMFVFQPRRRVREEVIEEFVRRKDLEKRHVRLLDPYLDVVDGKLIVVLSKAYIRLLYAVKGFAAVLSISALYLAISGGVKGSLLEIALAVLTALTLIAFMYTQQGLISAGFWKKKLSPTRSE